MASLIVQSRGIKVVNKGGGWATKMMTVGEKGYKRTVQGEAESRSKGSDYVVFNCGRCGQRNKQCLYDAIGRVGDTDTFSFKCKMCRTENEVSRPQPLVVVPQMERPQQMPSGSVLVDGYGRPISA